MKLTVAQAALLLGVKPGTIRAWIHQEKLFRQPDGSVLDEDLLDVWGARDTRMADLADKRWYVA